jgi:esterase
MRLSGLRIHFGSVMGLFYPGDIDISFYPDNIEITIDLPRRREMNPAAETAVADELIEMRGLRFHFRDWRSKQADAPNLVLLHGYTSHARSWDAFAEVMTDRYRVLALDQRGHGETDWAAADQYGIDDMADDLTTFAHALGLRRFALCGLSMGGMVTMEYAGRRPDELAACVIVDIGPEIVQSGSSRIQAGVRASDVFSSRDEAFAVARSINAVRPRRFIAVARMTA